MGRVSYLGLRNIILEKFVDKNDLIYCCQLPKAVLHDINASSSTHPIYLARICEYLHRKMEDIVSPFVYGKRAGIFMPWCYDPVKELGEQLKEFKEDHKLSLLDMVKMTEIDEMRLIRFMRHSTLSEHEISLLRRLGEEMIEYTHRCLDMMKVLSNGADAFETPVM